MVKVKMLISGWYGGIKFERGDVVEFSEDSLKGLDAKDYERVEGAEEEKQVEKSSDKMQRSRSKK